MGFPFSFFHSIIKARLTFYGYVMKTEAVGIPIDFKPVTVTFTLESQDEVNAFFRVGKEIVRDNNYGSIDEKIGQEMMDAVEPWARNA